jgi:hypothetical protein
MKMTVKQANVLRNLERVVLKEKRGKAVPFLDGEVCRFQINSLAAKKLIVIDRRGRPARIDEWDSASNRL